MTRELEAALETKDVRNVSQLIQNNPENLSGASLKEYTLRGLELHDLTITGASIYDTDLQRAKLTNVTFENCTLTGVDFSNSEFHNVRFMNTKLEPIGTTKYDVKETTFSNSLLDKVGFGDNSELLDVLMHSLVKGSSVAIIDSSIAVVVEGHSYIFSDSNLKKLLIDRTDIEKNVSLSLSIFGAEDVVIKNSSLASVDLLGIETQNLIIQNNKDVLLRITGECERVQMLGNLDSRVAFGGKIDALLAADNFGENSGISLRGEINNVEVRSNDGFGVRFSYGRIKNAIVSSCDNLRLIQCDTATVDNFVLNSLHVQEINFAQTTFKNMSIKDVVLTEKSWVEATSINEASIDNFKILPSTIYDSLFEETEGFWNDLLAQQK